MFNTRKFIATAAVTLATLGSTAAWANLVVNGDFESDPIGNSGLGNGPPPGLGFDYVSTLTGWTVSGAPRGVVLFDALYRPIGGGAQSLQLENPGNFIEQSINTVAGQLYTLTFDLGSYAPPGVSTLEVEIGTGPALLFADAGGGAYTTYSVQFTAASSSTLLHFESFGPGGTYPHLDDIAVAAVPEPTALALAGIALAGLAMARRQKKA